MAEGPRLIHSVLPIVVLSDTCPFPASSWTRISSSSSAQTVGYDSRVVARTAGDGTPASLEALSFLTFPPGFPDGLLATVLYITPRSGHRPPPPETLEKLAAHLDTAADPARPDRPHVAFGDWNSCRFNRPETSLLIATLEGHGLRPLFPPRPTNGGPQGRAIDWWVGNEAARSAIIGPQLVLPSLETKAKTGTGHDVLAISLARPQRLRGHRVKVVKAWRRLDVDKAQFLATFVPGAGGSEYKPLEERLPSVEEYGLDGYHAALCHALNDIAGQCVPEIKIKLDARKQPRWFTPRLRRAVRDYHDSHRRLQPHLDTNPAARTLLRRLAADKRRLIKVEKARYADYVCQKLKKQGKMFLSHRELQGHSGRAPLPALKLPGGGCATTDQAKADALAAQFRENQGPWEPSTDLPAIPAQQTPESQLLTPADVAKAIAKLKVTKATGGDGIPASLLQALEVQVAGPLHILYRECMRTQQTPSAFKASLACAIPKVPRPSTPAQCRAIFMIDAMVKIYDQKIARAVVRATKERFPQRQFARARSGCQDALVALQHAVMEHAERDKGARVRVAVVLLDAAKAYERVRHSAILRGLHRLGTPPWLLHIARDMLRGRSAEIRVGDAGRAHFATPAGIPAGTACSGIFFAAATASTFDLPMAPGTRLQAYVDDLAIVAPLNGPDDERNLRRDLDVLTRHLAGLGLHLNAAKSQLLIIEHTKSEGLSPPLFIDSQAVPEVPEAKFLGVMLDKRMSFVNHHARVSSMARRALSAAARLCSGQHRLIKHLYYERVSAVQTFHLQSVPPSTVVSWNAAATVVSTAAHLLGVPETVHRYEAISAARLQAPPLAAALSALKFVRSCVCSGRAFGAWLHLLHPPEPPDGRRAQAPDQADRDLGLAQGPKGVRLLGHTWSPPQTGSTIGTRTRARAALTGAELRPPDTHISNWDRLQPRSAVLLWNAVLAKIPAADLREALSGPKALVRATLPILAALRPEDKRLYGLNLLPPDAFRPRPTDEGPPNRRHQGHRRT